jgi:hypothetical protein
MCGTLSGSWTWTFLILGFITGLVVTVIIGRIFGVRGLLALGLLILVAGLYGYYTARTSGCFT